MDTKDKIVIILKKNSLFNVITDKSNNEKSKRILNMIIFVKDYYTFYIFSKSAEDELLDIAKNIY